MDRKRLKEILEQFKTKNILVIGDVGIDRYIHGTASRLSPEAPVPIFIEKSRENRPGLAANVTANLMALGAQVKTVGIVGLYNYQYLQEILGTDLILDESRPTTIKERYCCGTHHLLRVDTESTTNISNNIVARVNARIEDLCSENNFDAIIVQDYQKGLLVQSLTATLCKISNAKNIPIFTDPNSNADIKLYRGSTVITPNRVEAEILAGFKIGEHLERLAPVAKSLCSKVGCEYVVITLGAEGMAVYRYDWTDVKLISAKARQVFDVCGAGDTVIASLALAFCSQDNDFGLRTSIEEAAYLSNLAAAVKVGKFGTSTVTTQEILSSLDYL